MHAGQSNNKSRGINQVNNEMLFLQQDEIRDVSYKRYGFSISKITPTLMLRGKN